MITYAIVTAIRSVFPDNHYLKRCFPKFFFLAAFWFLQYKGMLNEDFAHKKSTFGKS